ncbi:kinase-like domain-containing protein [Melampsora americana]|nr:kinase-like domain-containing protein [Melampsora americana]
MASNGQSITSIYLSFLLSCFTFQTIEPIKKKNLSKWDDDQETTTTTTTTTRTTRTESNQIKSRPSKRSRQAAFSDLNISNKSKRTSSSTHPIDSIHSNSNPNQFIHQDDSRSETFINQSDDHDSNRRRSLQLRNSHPVIQGCRSVYCYERLNHIEEGSYGVVFRARDKESNQIVALKKIKMDQERNGFPITSLREIHTLMMVKHENIVNVREIVVGETLTQIFIVMDFIEHDLKTLLSTMRTPFLSSEIKTIMIQLLSAISCCHSNWIIHRDLKTSNILMNNRGQIKLADFGLARMYGDPSIGNMTQLVVTLWYRSPELLLGSLDYDPSIDLWSIGCIFAELILREPIFPGKGEIDQLHQIFSLLGKPNPESWPGLMSLPNMKTLNLSQTLPVYNSIRQKFRLVTELGIDLMNALLTYDPHQRISPEDALRHPYFNESPLPKHPNAFQSFPSIAAGEKAKFDSPSAPGVKRNEDLDWIGSGKGGMKNGKYEFV